MSEIDRVLVVGAGAMGHGIAHVAAAAGCEVDLHDLDGGRIARGLEQIRADLDVGVAKGKVTPEHRDAALSRLHAAPELEPAAERCSLACEAIFESLEAKCDLFRRLSAAAPLNALLATNTSALPVSEIARAARAPERILGMHFFNPVHLMPLLEIVRGQATSEESVTRALAFARLVGKEPIVVRDVPGFATSRLGVLLGLEAMRMVEDGVASAEDIDKAMTLGYRHPVGPLRLSDQIGLDIRLAIAEHLHRALGSEAFRPPEILRRLVAEGKLGRKSGAGFYEWNER